MTNVAYSVENGQLVIREQFRGNIIWKGPFEVPILQILPLAKIDGCLVLLDWEATRKPTFENLFMVGPDGSIRWKAQLPSSHNAFIEIIDRGHELEAHTWSGHLVEIDLMTGQTKNVRFVK